MDYTVVDVSAAYPGAPWLAIIAHAALFNADAIAEGAANATRIQTAALEQTGGSEAVTAACVRDGAIDTQAKMGSSIVGQGQLKSTTGQVSRTGVTGGALYTNPGGQYSLGGIESWGSDANADYHVSLGTSVVKADIAGNNSSAIAYISIYQGLAITRTVYGRVRYVQASPPYDLGDGEIPLFIFAEVTPSGEVVSVYEAPEAPWHYNGPTGIKANYYKNDKGYQIRKDAAEIDKAMVAAGHPSGLTKASSKALSMLAYQDYHLAFNAAKDIAIEVTQDIKQADMALIPRPMKPADGNTVVMLDPVADLTANLFEMKKHDEFSINELLHKGDLIITTETSRAGPPGVAVHGYKWR